MIHELLPTSYVRHLSLPVLGPVFDDFDDWLVLHGYQFNTRQSYLLRCSAIETYLHKRRQHSLSALTPESLRKCSQYFRHRPGGGSTRFPNRPPSMRHSMYPLQITADSYAK